MAGERIILCLGCGQQNRLSAGSRLELARCGCCSRPLGSPTKWTLADRGVLLVLVLMAGMMVYIVSNHLPSSPGTPQSPPSIPKTLLSDDEVFGHPADRVPDTDEHMAAEPFPSGQEASAPENPSIPLPTLKPALPVAISTGLVWVRPGRQRIAPLEIRVPSAYNYFVTLVNVTDRTEELSMYIEGGRTFTADVALGTYELYYDFRKNLVRRRLPIWSGHRFFQSGRAVFF